MNQIIVMTKEEAAGMIAEAVARGIDRLRPLLLKAATEYATEEEIEVRFGLPRRMLSAWRKDGEGPAFVQMEGHRPLYKVADVDAFLARHRVDPEDFGSGVEI